MHWVKAHKVLTIVLVVITLAIIGSASGGSKNKNQNDTTNNNKKDSAKTQELPKIGEAARDGKFEFTVKSVECGKTEVVSPDSDALRKSAQGQFCVMALSVKNIGDKQQGFFSMNQKLLDVANKQYATDDVATTYNSPMSQQNSWAQINPGNSIDATIVFDIPKDAIATTAELHDSAYSGGVKVDLRK